MLAAQIRTGTFQTSKLDKINEDGQRFGGGFVFGSQPTSAASKKEAPNPWHLGRINGKKPGQLVNFPVGCAKPDVPLYGAATGGLAVGGAVRAPFVADFGADFGAPKPNFISFALPAHPRAAPGAGRPGGLFFGGFAEPASNLDGPKKPNGAVFGLPQNQDGAVFGSSRKPDGAVFGLASQGPAGAVFRGPQKPDCAVSDGPQKPAGAVFGLASQEPAGAVFGLHQNQDGAVFGSSRKPDGAVFGLASQGPAGAVFRGPQKPDGAASGGPQTPASAIGPDLGSPQTPAGTVFGLLPQKPTGAIVSAPQGGGKGKDGGDNSKDEKCEDQEPEPKVADSSAKEQSVAVSQSASESAAGGVEASDDKQEKPTSNGALAFPGDGNGNGKSEEFVQGEQKSKASGGSASFRIAGVVSFSSAFPDEQCAGYQDVGGESKPPDKAEVDESKPGDGVVKVPAGNSFSFGVGGPPLSLSNSVSNPPIALQPDPPSAIEQKLQLDALPAATRRSEKESDDAPKLKTKKEKAVPERGRRDSAPDHDDTELTPPKKPLPTDATVEAGDEQKFQLDELPSATRRSEKESDDAPKLKTKKEKAVPERGRRDSASDHAELTSPKKPLPTDAIVEAGDGAASHETFQDLGASHAGAASHEAGEDEASPSQDIAASSVASVEPFDIFGSSSFSFEDPFKVAGPAVSTDASEEAKTELGDKLGSGPTAPQWVDPFAPPSVEKAPDQPAAGEEPTDRSPESGSPEPGRPESGSPKSGSSATGEESKAGSPESGSSASGSPASGLPASGSPASGSSIAGSPDSSASGSPGSEPPESGSPESDSSAPHAQRVDDVSLEVDADKSPTTAPRVETFAGKIDSLSDARKPLEVEISSAQIDSVEAAGVVPTPVVHISSENFNTADESKSAEEAEEHEEDGNEPERAHRSGLCQLEYAAPERRVTILDHVPGGHSDGESAAQMTIDIRQARLALARQHHDALKVKDEPADTPSHGKTYVVEASHAQNNKIEEKFDDHTDDSTRALALPSWVTDALPEASCTPFPRWEHEVKALRSIVEESTSIPANEFAFQIVSEADATALAQKRFREKLRPQESTREEKPLEAQYSAKVKGAVMATFASVVHHARIVPSTRLVSRYLHEGSDLSPPGGKPTLVVGFESLFSEVCEKIKAQIQRLAVVHADSKTRAEQDAGKSPLALSATVSKGAGGGDEDQAGASSKYRMPKATLGDDGDPDTKLELVELKHVKGDRTTVSAKFRVMQRPLIQDGEEKDDNQCDDKAETKSETEAQLDSSYKPKRGAHIEVSMTSTVDELVGVMALFCRRLGCFGVTTNNSFAYVALFKEVEDFVLPEATDINEDDYKVAEILWKRFEAERRAPKHGARGKKKLSPRELKERREAKAKEALRKFEESQAVFDLYDKIADEISSRARLLLHFTPAPVWAPSGDSKLTSGEFGTMRSGAALLPPGVPGLSKSMSTYQAQPPPAMRLFRQASTFANSTSLPPPPPPGGSIAEDAQWRNRATFHQRGVTAALTPPSYSHDERQAADSSSLPPAGLLQRTFSTPQPYAECSTTSVSSSHVTASRSHRASPRVGGGRQPALLRRLSSRNLLRMDRDDAPLDRALDDVMGEDAAQVVDAVFDFVGSPMPLSTTKADATTNAVKAFNAADVIDAIGRQHARSDLRERGLALFDTFISLSSSPEVSEEVIWNLYTCLTDIFSDNSTNDVADERSRDAAENNSVYHAVCAVGHDKLSKLRSHLSAILTRLVSLLSSVPADSMRFMQLQILCLKCWRVSFDREDHTFLMDSKIFPILRRLMTMKGDPVTSIDTQKASNTPHTPVAPTSPRMFEELAAVGANYLTWRTRLNSADVFDSIKCSSNFDRSELLIDDSLDTFWESRGGDDGGLFRRVMEANAEETITATLKVEVMLSEVVIFADDKNKFPRRIKLLYGDSFQDEIASVNLWPRENFEVHDPNWIVLRPLPEKNRPTKCFQLKFDTRNKSDEPKQFRLRLIQLFSPSPLELDVGQPEENKGLKPPVETDHSELNSDDCKANYDSDNVDCPTRSSIAADLPSSIEVSAITPGANTDRAQSRLGVQDGPGTATRREQLLYKLERSRLVDTLRKEALQTFRMLTEQCFRGLGDGVLRKNKSSMASRKGTASSGSLPSSVSKLTRQTSTDLRMRVLDMLFEDSTASSAEHRLNDLQRLIFELVLSEIQTTLTELKELVVSNCNAVAMYDLPPDSLQDALMITPQDDEYCYELVSLVLTLNHSIAGQKFLGTPFIIEKLLSTIVCASPRIHRSLYKVFKRVLPHVKPSLLEARPNVQDRGGFLALFLQPIASSLEIQVRNSASVSSTDASLKLKRDRRFHDPILELGAFRALLPAEARSLMALLGHLLEHAGAAWREHMITGLRNALAPLTDFRRTLSSSEVNSHSSSSNITKFHEAVASVCVIGMLNNYEADADDSNSPPQKHSALQAAPNTGRRTSAQSLRPKALVKDILSDPRLGNRVQVDSYAGTCRARVLEPYDNSSQSSDEDMFTGMLISVDLERCNVIVEVRQRQSKEVRQCRFCGMELKSDGSNSAPKLDDCPESLEDVCDSEECVEFRSKACGVRLACGHACRGLADERECLPCVEPGCRDDLKQDGDDFCTICWTENLSACPTIKLTSCGHMFHAHCVRRILEIRWSGAHISFGFLECPLCKVHMEHPSLVDLLTPVQDLLDAVKKKAFQRLKFEKQDGEPEVIEKDSKFYNDPHGFAMSKYSYYLCFKCKRPYYGGLVACGVAASDNFDPSELLCGGCSPILSEDCPKHGKDYIEFKCRYCCSVAIFFCFGTTHFCNTCHDNYGILTGMSADEHPKCPVRYLPSSRNRPEHDPDMEECPLGVEHPETGQEYGLGCGLCRNSQR